MSCPPFEPEPRVAAVIDRFCAAAGGERSQVAARVANRLLVLRMCEARGLEPRGGLLGLAAAPDLGARLATILAAARTRYGELFAAEPGLADIPTEPLRELCAELCAAEAAAGFDRLPVEALGQIYEQGLATAPGRAARKARGVYYTPRAIADQLVADTVLPVAADRSVDQLLTLRLVDPACGSGIFLLRGFAALLALHLAAWRREPEPRRRDHVYRRSDGSIALGWAERRRILVTSIFGADRDRHAIELAKLSLILEALGPGSDPAPGQLELLPRRDLPDLAGHLRWADSVIGPDFEAAVDGSSDPAAVAGEVADVVRVAGLSWPNFAPVAAGGFDVVLGNPPWGQKQIVASADEKQYLVRRFPSARGIFDWFRPFVELGVSLVRPGGAFGMVLPDIVLLKNYQATRCLLLEQLSLTRIAWLGMAFPGATIDAVTIAGRRRPAPPDHRVEVAIRGRGDDRDHTLAQADFRANPRCCFNLLLTADRRRVVEQLADRPRLGDWFEVHEGVHSGNIRRELFVAGRLDDSCRELYFGRDELRRYALSWAGRYVRLSVIPQRRSRARYANLGRPEWHERDKLVVRRTGDAVLAAVDRAARYASNNFFVVVPRAGAPLGLDGLCALLNSRFLTWYFRAVEPRQGRAFAELKIKHLVDFPLPAPQSDAGWETFERLGRERGQAAMTGDQRVAAAIDGTIDAAVLAAYAIEPADVAAAGMMEGASPAERGPLQSCE